MISPPDVMEPAFSSVNEVMVKSGVVRAEVPLANGANPVMSKRSTSPNERPRLFKSDPSARFFESINGHIASLTLPLKEQLIEQAVMFTITDA